MRLAWELALWLACRILTLLALTLPNGYFIPSDLNVFADWAGRIADGGPISGDLWQYPAGVAMLLGIVGTTGGGVAALVGVIAASDLTIQLLLRRSAGAVLWAIAPVFVGPIMLTRLDTVVALTAIAGLMARSPFWSGIWLGLGASLKLWPGALVTAARDRSLARVATAGGAVLTVTLVTYTVFDPPAFLANQRGRGLQVESLAAWPFMVARWVGAPVELVYRNGSTEISGQLADSIATLLLPLTLVAVAVLLHWSWRNLAPNDRYASAAHALTVVLVLMLCSRVLSPQFIVWPIGMAALMLTATKTRGFVVWCLLGSALTGQILYPHAYLDYLGRGLLGLGIQSARLALLIAAAWLSWRTIRALATARRAQLPPGEA